MDEYASTRLRSVCTTAAMVPTASDTTARPMMTGRQSVRYTGKATTNTRRNAANPATLVAEDMKPVTGVGAPW